MSSTCPRETTVPPSSSSIPGLEIPDLDLGIPNPSRLELSPKSNESSPTLRLRGRVRRFEGVFEPDEEGIYISLSLSGVRLDLCRIGRGREAEERAVEDDREDPRPREELEAYPLRRGCGRRLDLEGVPND